MLAEVIRNCCYWIGFYNLRLNSQERKINWGHKTCKLWFSVQTSWTVSALANDSHFFFFACYCISFVAENIRKLDVQISQCKWRKTNTFHEHFRTVKEVLISFSIKEVPIEEFCQCHLCMYLFSHF